jgi:hypothetical protein
VERWSAVEVLRWNGKDIRWFSHGLAMVYPDQISFHIRFHIRFHDIPWYSMVKFSHSSFFVLQSFSISRHLGHVRHVLNGLDLVGAQIHRLANKGRAVWKTSMNGSYWFIMVSKS